MAFCACIGQNVTVTMFNETGYVLDSIQSPSGNLIKLNPGDSCTIHYESIFTTGNNLFGTPPGVISEIEGKKWNGMFCGTGVTMQTEGHFKSDINFRKVEQGYMLFWTFHP